MFFYRYLQFINLKCSGLRMENPFFYKSFTFENELLYTPVEPSKPAELILGSVSWNKQTAAIFSSLQVIFKTVFNRTLVMSSLGFCWVHQTQFTGKLILKKYIYRLYVKYVQKINECQNQLELLILWIFKKN